jgi:hypothetical protein
VDIGAGGNRRSFLAAASTTCVPVSYPLDLAKRTEILRDLRRGHRDLIIVDEAHRMFWSPIPRVVSFGCASDDAPA